MIEDTPIRRPLTRVQIWGSNLPCGYSPDPIHDQQVKGEATLEDAVDHLIKVNRILVEKIKTNEARFHRLHRQEKDLNKMLMRRIDQIKDNVDLYTRRVFAVEDRKFEIK